MRATVKDNSVASNCERGIKEINLIYPRNMGNLPN